MRHSLFDLRNGKQLTLETASLIGDNEVKALAMGPTDGLQRGMKVRRTFAPIVVPVGESTLGRIFNVLGDAIDGEKFDKNQKGLRFEPIHKAPPLCLIRKPNRKS